MQQRKHTDPPGSANVELPFIRCGLVQHLDDLAARLLSMGLRRVFALSPVRKHEQAPWPGLAHGLPTLGSRVATIASQNLLWHVQREGAAAAAQCSLLLRSLLLRHGR